MKTPKQNKEVYNINLKNTTRVQYNQFLVTELQFSAISDLCVNWDLHYFPASIPFINPYIVEILLVYPSF